MKRPRANSKLSDLAAVAEIHADDLAMAWSDFQEGEISLGELHAHHLRYINSANEVAMLLNEAISDPDEEFAMNPEEDHEKARRRAARRG